MTEANPAGVTIRSLSFPALMLDELEQGRQVVLSQCVQLLSKVCVDLALALAVEFLELLPRQRQRPTCIQSHLLQYPLWHRKSSRLDGTQTLRNQVMYTSRDVHATAWKLLKYLMVRML